MIFAVLAHNLDFPFHRLLSIVELRSTDVRLDDEQNKLLNFIYEVINQEKELLMDGNEDFEFPINDEMIAQFIQEAISGFEKIEENLLTIERIGFEQNLLDEAYRIIHSYKGNCGFMNFMQLEKLSHKLETLFEIMKQGRLPITENNIAGTLKILDVIQKTTLNIAESRNGDVENFNTYDQLVDDLVYQNKKKHLQKIVNPIKKVENINTVVKNIKKTSEVEKEIDQKIDSKNSDIRVNLDKIDEMVNLVGELMIVSQMMTRNPNLGPENQRKFFHQLNGLVTELQDAAMSIRMIPLEGTFKKMVRLVRDLSKKSKKLVKLDTFGEDTELDKTVVEQISDPLMHLVRNAIDHGIETREQRLAQSKPKEGMLAIEAKYEGNEVWIDIIDDGSGLNREKILRKAKEMNLVQSNGHDLSDDKVFNLIFEPGFSTAVEITSVSGRGVGLDVVKRNIEKVKGYIKIKSKPGKGSTFSLRIPLTIAIIDGMLVRVGKSIYTIPLLAIRESIQIEKKQITLVDGNEVVQLRNQLIPVFRLHLLHHLTPDYENLEEGILIFLEYQDEVFGLFVDELLGQYQTIIKGLSEYLGKIPGVSGCSILSNGELSLILDVADLRQGII
ncbi:MAG: chemotaxis protein CheA [Deltaproteobacteria bacterium]|jgi:two-component system, chemotaxis family, sensor kinase CheA|nr:chemotaxis protein CheA [Deltaproteobacteria bacterium]MBT4525540.1 chemotaxis protein CheA [Deltaproteobacteria bacterium]